MCRFLLYKSNRLTKPEKILRLFANMAKNSQALDGDWQGDGWGISWLDNKNCWQTTKSQNPIWNDMNKFSSIPVNKLFVIHARSASFPQHKDNVNYNQPYVNNNYVFVFNGLLKGVRIKSDKNSEIGAQKIWSLLQNILKTHPPLVALNKLKQILLNNSEKIQALNIGLSDKKNLYSLCYFSSNPDYYQLHYFSKNNTNIICSESLKDYSFNDLQSSEIILF